MRRAISRLNSQCGLRLVILLRVKLSMLLGVAELNKLHRRAEYPAHRALRRHEDLGRVFSHVQPLANGNVVGKLIRLVKA